MSSHAGEGNVSRNKSFESSWIIISSSNYESPRIFAIFFFSIIRSNTTCKSIRIKVTSAPKKRGETKLSLDGTKTEKKIFFSRFIRILASIFYSIISILMPIVFSMTLDLANISRKSRNIQRKWQDSIDNQQAYIETFVLYITMMIIIITIIHIYRYNICVYNS